MKKRICKIASFIAAASLSASLVTQMPMSASAAPTYYYYNDTYSTIQYTLTTVNGEARAEITKVTSKDWVNSSGNVFIYIPTRLSGRPVSFGSYAFQQMNTPFEINATDIREIKSYAFYNCKGLKEFYVSQKTTNIANSAFYGCTNLEKAIFQGYQYSVNDDSSLTIETNAFRTCTALNTISFGCRDDIIIKTNAFNGCKNLKNFDRFKASNDHSSMYVQSGAFNGTGIVSNSNAVKSASFMASHNGRYNCGDAKKMVGNVLIMNLLVNATDLPSYDSNSSYGVYYGAGYNSSLLEGEARKYGVSLDIQAVGATINTNMKASEIAGCGNFTSSNVCRDGLKNKFSFLSGCTNMDQVTAALKQHYNADQIAYVVNLNANQGCYAYSFMGSKEYAVVYSKCSVSYNNAHVWLHEVCHLFGAMDEYEGRVNNSSYTSTYMNHDAMFHNEPNIGWFTACNIGWTDTVLTEDYNAVVRDGAAGWIDYD